MAVEQRSARENSFPVIWHEEVGSTNSAAMELAENGETGPVWIAALAQSQGRGRKGRDWVSPKGNLYASLLITVECEVAVAVQTGFIAALAISDLAKAVLPDNKTIVLKWPNDVLVEGAKMSGILAETGPITRSDMTRLVIGCGLNLANSPQGTPYPATNLKEQGGDVNPQDAFDILNGWFCHWLDVWDHGAGFDAIRNAWTERSVPVGTPLSVNLDSGQTSGTFAGLAIDGALLLKMSDGSERAIRAGDVTQRPGGGSSTGWQRT